MTYSFLSKKKENTTRFNISLAKNKYHKLLFSKQSLNYKRNIAFYMPHQTLFTIVTIYIYLKAEA